MVKPSGSMYSDARHAMSLPLYKSNASEPRAEKQVAWCCLPWMMRPRLCSKLTATAAMSMKPKSVGTGIDDQLRFRRGQYVVHFDLMSALLDAIR